METVEYSLKHYFLKNQIVAALILVVAGWFIIQIKEILILFFISYILTAALTPYAQILHGYKIPRTISVAIVYLVTLAIVVLLIVPLIPFFSAQVSSLIISFPRYLDGILNALGVEIGAPQLQSLLANQLENIGTNALAITGTILNLFFSLFLVFVVSFYLMLDHGRVKKELSLLFPKDEREKVEDLVEQVDNKLGAWFRGQLVLGIFIGVFTWMALSLISFPFALPLALLAGILEIVPTIGPILSAIPAVIVALSISPAMTLVIILIYIVIQLLENNLLVPKVMQQAVGLNPIVVILAISIGATILGVLGALLSIPFLTMIIVIVKNLRKE
jgi:predicted PurR-regulated permease PerM